MRLTRTALAGALLCALMPAPGHAIARTIAPAASTQADAGPAQARPRVNVNVRAEGPLAVERADDAAYVTAVDAANTGGFAALQTHVPALMAALENAPATYPVIQQIDGGWLIRADQRDEMMALAARVGDLEAERGSSEAKVVSRPNVYPNIAFLLGSAAVERRDFAAAHAALDRGLALQPLDRMLLNEKLVTLHAERRWQDAYVLVKAALAADDPLITADPGSLQRRLGYTLVELGRLQEAQAAYEASLITDPDNATALAELEFIAGAIAGQPTSGEMTITAPNMPVPPAPAAPAMPEPSAD